MSPDAATPGAALLDKGVAMDLVAVQEQLRYGLRVRHTAEMLAW